ncbi:hypothetical protein AB0B50_03805 [Streptomyces sp. NPDC041068]|uniref:hypothetical protein n=1 Tax=Streptomyces sp. NPDC041068 TaxID=3155130 RepID=UPI0033F17738
MTFIIATAVVLVAAVVAGVIVLRRRGGSGERGALERAAADQGLAQGLSAANAARQNAGSYGP